MAEPHSTHPSSVPRPRRLLPFLLVLFVGSGCAALIYEIVWFQMLQLVIGSSAVSLGVLLGTFMGGMCIGSLALPRIISPQRHPLAVYALIELGIGVIGITLLFAMPYIGRLYIANVGHGLLGILWRGVVCALCLLPPTVLMGATLPAIARWIETTPQGVSWLGFFYGGNIAGAVFGCLLAGFYFLRVHDLATATCVAATINGTVAVLSIGLTAWTSHRSHETPSHSSSGSARALPEAILNKTPYFDPLPLGGEDTGEGETGFGQRVITRQATIADEEHAPDAWPVYLTIALSGMCALGAEVIWTRLLSLLLGGTVYTFSIILAVFLIGLGLGSSIGSILSRGKLPPKMALGTCQLLLTAAIAWSAIALAKSLPYWPINPALSPSPWFNFQIDLVRCMWAILPATILWGASFPLALAALAAPEQDPGRLVGGVYAANTVGAIVGAIGF